MGKAFRPSRCHRCSLAPPVATHARRAAGAVAVTTGPCRLAGAAHRGSQCLAAPAAAGPAVRRRVAGPGVGASGGHHAVGGAAPGNVAGLGSCPALVRRCRRAGRGVHGAVHPGLHRAVRQPPQLFVRGVPGPCERGGRHPAQGPVAVPAGGGAAAADGGVAVRPVDAARVFRCPLEAATGAGALCAAVRRAGPGRARHAGPPAGESGAGRSHSRSPGERAASGLGLHPALRPACQLRPSPTRPCRCATTRPACTQAPSLATW